MDEKLRRRVRCAAVTLVMVMPASCGDDDGPARSAPSTAEIDSPPTISADKPAEEAVTDTSTALTAAVPTSNKDAPTTEVATTEVSTSFGCSGAATTTTTVTTSTGLASLCDLIDSLPPDRVEEEWESVWDGTVSGAVQPVGCSPVSQTGSIILLVLSDGEVVGAGSTDTGAYSCDNGAAIPPSSLAYGIAGELTDHFALTFADGVTLTSGIVTDGHAVALQDTGFGVVTIELQCRDCAEDVQVTVASPTSDG
jgi:hypothetical protein